MTSPLGAAHGTSGGVGKKLREARERRGTSLRQVANATKISMAVLEALERNDISRLPGGIFSRAFVRSYAAEVGLDPDQTVQEFVDQFPDDSVTAGHPASRKLEADETHESDRKTANVFVKLLVVSVPAALLVMYYAAPGRISQPPAPEPDPAPVSTTAAPNELARSPVPSDGSTVAEAGTIAGEQAVTGGLTVVVSASGVGRVTAMADGQRVLDRELQPGQREVLDAQSELVLTATDAAAVSLTVNGAEARPLGKPGEPVTIRLTPANISEYLAVQ